MIFDELSNFAFRFALRCAGAEIDGYISLCIKQLRVDRLKIQTICMYITAETQFLRSEADAVIYSNALRGGHNKSTMREEKSTAQTDA